MKKLNLLYVEDDLEALEDTKFLLQNFYETIETAVDGEEAFEKFKSFKPDVLILDINLPKLNGINLALKIRKINTTVPILFLTAYSDSDKLLKAINMGANGYLVKPYTFTQLKERVVKMNNTVYKNLNISLCGDYIWDRELKKLFLKDSEISITKNEKGLTQILVENSAKFYTSAELASELLEKEENISKENNIVQLISRFRNKMQNNYPDNDFFIENIYGLGYRIILKE